MAKNFARCPQAAAWLTNFTDGVDMPRKQKPENIKALKQEARSRFETFIAAALAESADVGTEALAKDFYVKEEKLLKKIEHHTFVQILVKWADDILSQSVSREAARNGSAQLVLPLNCQASSCRGLSASSTGRTNCDSSQTIRPRSFTSNHIATSCVSTRKISIIRGLTSSG